MNEPYVGQDVLVRNKARGTTYCGKISRVNVGSVTVAGYWGGGMPAIWPNIYFVQYGNNFFSDSINDFMDWAQAMRPCPEEPQAVPASVPVPDDCFAPGDNAILRGNRITYLRAKMYEWKITLHDLAPDRVGAVDDIFLRAREDAAGVLSRGA